MTRRTTRPTCIPSPDSGGSIVAPPEKTPLSAMYPFRQDHPAAIGRTTRRLPPRSPGSPLPMSTGSIAPNLRKTFG
jgi:hypothetical protein